ncbi:MAG: hypothetical protein RL490_1414 [Pseudomonadota bacterium]|jgi:multiple antibiotic resistance protein
MAFSDILIILLITAGATKAAAYFAANAAHLTLAERRQVAIQSVGIQAIVLAIFVARGPNILALFHVSVEALEVAGGLILLLFAIGLVLGEDHSADENAPKPTTAMATYPLAVPLLASPQAIVAITIFSTTAGTGNRGPIWLALGAILALNLVVMLAIAQFVGGKEPGQKSGSGSAILLRVVALLLAALAIEIMALGLRGYGIIPEKPPAKVAGLAKPAGH